MSRIGRMPITVPEGVTVDIKQGEVTVTGPKGQLRRRFNPDISITLNNNTLTVSRPSDSKVHRSLHGLTRSLLANMVEGVTKGFERNLEMVGIGYRAEKAGDKLQDAASRTAIIHYLSGLADIAYDNLEKRIGDKKMMKNVERAVYLRAIDTLWIEHLDLMDHLRRGIGLRGYGQRDPLIEYKKEAYRLFNELLNNIQRNVVYTIFKVGVAQQVGQTPMATRQQQFSAPAKTSDQAPRSPYQNMSTGQQPGQPAAPVQPAVDETRQTAAGNLITKDGKKVGRNDPCPCGSGKKFKKCHGK